MDGMETIYFSMIAAVGSARSYYIEAVQKAKNGSYAEAEMLMKAGYDSFVEGHRAHSELIAKEANGEAFQVTLLMLHAEDQMMSAESFGILAQEFIDVYKKISK